jgi:TrmH RNA methyltransferase
MAWKNHKERRPPRQAPVSPPSEGIEIVQGVRAGLAVLARRPGDVVRVAFAREVRHEVADAMRRGDTRAIRWDEVGEPELHRLADSTHHEGLCVAVRARRWLPAHDLAEALVRSSRENAARGGGTAIALDRVRNPYNVGAILRSAAFFGVDAALLGAPAPHPGLAPTAVRVAEGGAEHLLLSRTTDLADTLARLRSRAVRVVGADAHAPESAFGFAFPRPAVLVVGNEREGLGDRVRAQCDALVRIPGGGAVESLNVAAAAGVLLGQMMRDR